MKHLWLSPFTLHKRVVAAVRNEVQLARRGQAGAHHRQDERAARAAS